MATYIKSLNSNTDKVPCKLKINIQNLVLDLESQIPKIGTQYALQLWRGTVLTQTKDFEITAKKVLIRHFFEKQTAFMHKNRKQFASKLIELRLLKKEVSRETK